MTSNRKNNHQQQLRCIFNSTGWVTHCTEAYYFVSTPQGTSLLERNNKCMRFHNVQVGDFIACRLREFHYTGVTRSSRAKCKYVVLDFKVTAPVRDLILSRHPCGVLMETTVKVVDIETSIVCHHWAVDRVLDSDNRIEFYDENFKVGDEYRVHVGVALINGYYLPLIKQILHKIPNRPVVNRIDLSELSNALKPAYRDSQLPLEAPHYPEFDNDSGRASSVSMQNMIDDGGLKSELSSPVINDKTKQNLKSLFGSPPGLELKSKECSKSDFCDTEKLQRWRALGTKILKNNWMCENMHTEEITELIQLLITA